MTDNTPHKLSCPVTDFNDFMSKRFPDEPGEPKDLKEYFEQQRSKDEEVRQEIARLKQLKFSPEVQAKIAAMTIERDTLLR